MAGVSKETGIIVVLAKRMVEERLPKALALKARVDKGEVLNEMDLRFLEQVVVESDKIKPLARFLHALLDHASNLLVITSGVKQTLLDYKQEQIIPEAAWDR